MNYYTIRTKGAALKRPHKPGSTLMFSRLKDAKDAFRALPCITNRVIVHCAGDGKPLCTITIEEAQP